METIYIDARSPKRPDGLWVGVTIKIDELKFAVENDSEVVVHKESNLVFVSKPATLLIGTVLPYDQYFQVLHLNEGVVCTHEILPEYEEIIEHMGVFGKEKYSRYITPVKVTFKINEFYKATINGRITRMSK